MVTTEAPVWGVRPQWHAVEDSKAVLGDDIRNIELIAKKNKLIVVLKKSTSLDKGQVDAVPSDILNEEVDPTGFESGPVTPRASLPNPNQMKENDDTWRK